MRILRKLERFLNEATYTGGYLDIGFNTIATDDDHPTGNILMGRPYTKHTVDAPGGAFRMSIPDDEWQWDVFEKAKGMEFIRNYHPSLADNKILQSLYGKRIFRHSRKKEDPTKAMAKLNIERDKEPEATMSGIEDIEKKEDIVKEDILTRIDMQLK